MTLHKKWNFPLRTFSENVTKLQFPANLVKFTEEILNGKLHFLCSVTMIWCRKLLQLVIISYNENILPSAGDCSIQQIVKDKDNSASIFISSTKINEQIADYRNQKRQKFDIFQKTQKQPFRGVLEKRCSENMQQMYRRTPMPKRGFNKVA